MNNLQRIGGIAAMVEATTFVVGFALLMTTLGPLSNGELDAAAQVSFLAEHATITYAWNLIIYVVFGVFLAVLARALHERLKSGAPALMQVATALGLIWAGLVIASGMVANVGAAAVIDLAGTDPARAGTVWLAVDTVVNGLGGGNEIVGGLWVVLLSVAALRSGALPKALSYLGLVAGSAGVITLAPPLTDVGAVFGLGLIVWFVWLGIVLLRRGNQA